MAGRSTVSVYSVHHNGSTGALEGTGLLVDPWLVLAAPPLADRLAGGEHLRLRLGIAAAAAGSVEVLDVAHVRVSRGAGQVLVGLEPTAPAQSPPEVVDGLQDATDADSLRAVGVTILEDADRSGVGTTGVTAPSSGPTLFARTQMSLWCRMMHWGCPHD